jgi:hypothetical protein
MIRFDEIILLQKEAKEVFIKKAFDQGKELTQRKKGINSRKSVK